MRSPGMATGMTSKRPGSAASAASRGVRMAVAVAWLAAASSAPAAMPGARHLLAPDQVFVQLGAAADAHTPAAGAAWDWRWQRDFASGKASGYWEASFGRWNSRLDDGRRASAWVTQLGVTPVLRWQPRAWGEAWFVEAGIGANVLLPVYRSRDKRFSTAFNFGDHLAIGRRFGVDRQHELALRVQHFSNAGIKDPNPSEDFDQLRYAWRY